MTGEQAAIHATLAAAAAQMAQALVALDGKVTG